MDNKINMTKSKKWEWLNLMVERGIFPPDKAAKLKRDLASGKVVHNPIVGLISKIQLDNLVRERILIKKEGKWCIPSEVTISGGKKIFTVSKKFSEWYNRKRALATADFHRREEIDILASQKENEDIQESVHQLFTD